MRTYVHLVQYISALTTFDILRHYADLPIESIEDTANVIDDPSNGLALQKDVHNGFDRFRWSLKETAVRLSFPSSLMVADKHLKTPNQYTTFIYEKGHGFLQAEPQTVTFTDKSCAFDELSPRPHKRLLPNVTGISLPNPLHAIAGVLHMSGAGECIDRALDRAGKGATGVLFTGADFAHLGLAEDLAGAMSQVAVH
jgi:hypothetical protein